ncbi:MAG: putative lysogenic conversion protein (Hypothetical protein) [uncultured bacterium]|nr:MAG: putative lysogenic conversion protein (Hypothetical protein) [uncultured bacterium]
MQHKNVNFKKIKNGDDWEFFARDFFKSLGYEIILDPTRGADGGKDLIIGENLLGIQSKKTKKWLVSCKHYAESGKAVGVNDELNITDRLKQHGCDGFIGFYSSSASTALQERLRTASIEFDLYDYRKIEGILFDKKLNSLLSRYFPELQTKDNTNYLENIIENYIPLNCEHCGKDLLKDNAIYSGIIVYMENYETNTIENIYVCCKGNCDRLLINKYKKTLIDKWEDLGDLSIPAFYIKNINTLLKIAKGLDNKITEEALEQAITIFLALSQKICRKTTQKEFDRIQKLLSFERIGL